MWELQDSAAKTEILSHLFESESGVSDSTHMHSTMVNASMASSLKFPIICTGRFAVRTPSS